MSSRKKISLTATLVVVLSLLVGAFVLGQKVDNSRSDAAAQSAPRVSGVFGLDPAVYDKLAAQADKSITKIVSTATLPDAPAKISPITGFCSAFFVGEERGVTNGTMLTAGHCDLLKEAKNHFAKACKRLEPKNPEPESQEPEGDVPFFIIIKKKAETCPFPLPEPTVRYQMLYPHDLDNSCVGAKPNTGPTDVRILASMPAQNGDVALLKADGLECTPVLPIATRDPLRGEQIVSTGFPAEMNMENTGPDQPRQTDDEEEDPYSKRPGQVAKDLADVRFRTHSVYSFYAGPQFPATTIGDTELTGATQVNGLSAAIEGGTSGGPTLILEDNILKVAGINSFSMGDAGSMTYTASPGTITMFLRSQGVKFEGDGNPAAKNSDTAQTEQIQLTAQTTTQVDPTVQTLQFLQNQASQTLAWQLIAALASVAAIVLLGLLLLRNRASRPVQSTAPDKTT